MRPMRHDDPPGTPVSVVLDDCTIWRTRTRSETWTVGGSHRVVLLEGRAGGYLVKRCSVIEPGDLERGEWDVVDQLLTDAIDRWRATREEEP